MILAACLTTILINLSAEPLNDRDLQEKAAASKRCFYVMPGYPCLAKFIKVQPLIYRALCAEELK